MLYKLKLLVYYKIYKVFHISLSKKYVFDTNHVLFRLPKVALKDEVLT
jgi:hypothetical protein